MPVAKLSISLANEVDQALAVLSARTRQAKSALIEVALRENPLVAHYIEVVRAEWLAEPIAVPRREVMEEIERRRAAKLASPSEKETPIRARPVAARRR